MEIKRASELGEKGREMVSEAFVDGFGHDLRFFSKDKKKLAKALEHMFNLDVFYVALIDGEVAGITVLSDGHTQSINHNKKELRKHLGLYKGTIANIVFKKEFQQPSTKTGEKVASVGFVATAEKYRRRGVASAIMNHLFALPEYNEYILDGVADTNIGAIKLCEKLGFKEVKRVKQKHSKLSGINYYLYMRYEQNESML